MSEALPLAENMFFQKQQVSVSVNYIKKDSELVNMFLCFQPLQRALFFKFFEKTQPIQLYWFAAQQQTSTYRLKKSDLFYPRFSSEFNELRLKL